MEVDGLWHQRRIALDERCDKVLTRMRYAIVHLEAVLVVQQPLVAVERIYEAIKATK